MSPRCGARAITGEVMSPSDPELEVVLTDTVVATANYAYLPFDVPPGITRLDVAMTTDRGAFLGLGLFDARGSAYQSPGFRGIAGVERREFFVALDAATPGFTPGPIEPGSWTVMIPVFLAVLPTRVTVRVRMTRGRVVPPRVPEPLQGVVRDVPGWYRGDLHCHTEASTDAWASGTSMTPAGWADAARAHGLDFLAMTDHNVISQNYALRTDAGQGVLLIAGEEMTNYFHGHATVAGIEPGEWLDFRQSPMGLPLPTGGARISEFLRAARSMGAYVSAAHPLAPTMAWQFLIDGAFDESARPDGFEVWNGPWQVNEEVALRVWDHLLGEGWDIAANGGSDLHATGNVRGYTVGLPTTVVYAEQLSREAIINAVRRGRSFVTRSPVGVDVYLTARMLDGQETFTGGRIYGAVGDEVTAAAHVRRGGGMRLRLITEQGAVDETLLEGDDITVERTVRIGREHGFVRAEVRGEARPPGMLPVPQLDMEAFTNPIRIVVGEVPTGTMPEFAPPR
jgi:predicted metal-dependent phosphoesterase TrpH